jgi:hypothetical protein
MIEGDDQMVSFGYDQIIQNAPDPIRTLKLSCIEPA